MLFGGYIRLKSDGFNIGYFADKCKKCGYPLYNIQKTKEGVFFDVRSKDYKEITVLIRKTGVNVETCKKFGIVMKLLIYKSRKAFLGVIFFLALFYGINSCYISEIHINGNEIFSDKQIMTCLNENGLYEGRLKFGIDPNIFQNEVIKDFPELSWIWLRIDGTKAIVDVREKITKPEFFDYKNYGNMVACRNGIVKNAIASGGTLLVNEGMYVKKGDILISGVYDSTDNAPVRFINADGIVKAETDYSIEDVFDCSYVSYSINGNPKTYITPRIFDINLWDNKNDGPANFIMDKKDIKYRVFGKNNFPLAFTKTKYCEIIKKEYTLSETDAKEYAAGELTNKLMLSLPDGAEIVDTKKDITSNADGTFKVSVSIKCIENIAVKQPILVEEE